MKTRIHGIVAMLAIAGSLSLTVWSCSKDVIVPNENNEEIATTRASQGDEVFYYYGYENKKICLREMRNQVYVKFAPDATREQFQAVANNRAFSRSRKINGTTVNFIKGASYNALVLESREITPDDLRSFRSKKEIVSASYLLEYNGSFLAVTDEFVVKLKETATYAQLQDLAGQYGCAIGKENEFVQNQFKLYVSKDSERDAMQTANLFYETGLFEFSEPNFMDLDALDSLDPYFPEQWGLKNTALNGVDIKVEQAWAITKGSPDIKIAVIDQGVDLTHPDLQANLLPGRSFGSIITTTTNGGPFYDDDNHGTPVAGIIAAVQDNNEGISGVAPGCKIIPIKANVGDSFRDYGADAIYWAVQQGASVINCSWHLSSESTPITNAINEAVNLRGVVVVCASGNDDDNPPFTGEPVSFPANLPNVIAVGAIGDSGARVSFSNYGPELDVMAPGLYIHATDRQGTAGINTASGTAGDYYGHFTGTSAAAPFVSGVVALMLSKNPDLTPDEVRTILRASATPLSGGSNQVGRGLVNASLAVSMTPTQPTNYITNYERNTSGMDYVPFYPTDDWVYNFSYPLEFVILNDPNAGGYTYIWDAEYYGGECDWYWFINTNSRYEGIEARFPSSSAGGRFLITCKVYDRSTLITENTYYLDVYNAGY